ncbi:hypothetical protein CAC42_3375 [Sphaceloma murrayae]|uniref:MYND-type domain-containing protein n=1 Tax=Sphaceloma murrayae TaxID=2082308 RepID=A0A2K1R160_9PEZI|nr:hypothetical protein CAC42_3375 [Sphaceloma murrayae]
MATTCVVCGTTTSIQCGGCADSPSADLTTNISVYYCNNSCQKADHESHKAACKAARHRKLLVLTAEHVQATILEYIRITWASQLVGVERVDDDELHMLISRKSRLNPIILGGKTYPFPEPLWSRLTDEEQKAILTKGYCTEATVMAEWLMMPVLGPFIQGSARGLLSIGAKIVPMRMTYVIVDGNVGVNAVVGTAHTVLKITLQSGECFAVDFTGAQFGWYDSIMRWDDWMQNRVVVVTSRLGPVQEVKDTMWLGCTGEHAKLAKRLAEEMHAGAVDLSGGDNQQSRQSMVEKSRGTGYGGR